jgi:sugar phosphate isomerase/epimerase
MIKAIQIAYDNSFEKECMIVSEAGFKHVSVNFNNTPIPTDDTYDRAPDHILGVLDKYGLRAVQTHLYYYYPLLSAEKTEPELEHRILREIEVSGKIGAEWCAWHTRYYKSGEWQSGEFNEELTLRYNYESISRYLEQAKKFGTGIAIENLFGIMMFGGTDLLMRICDSLRSDAVGICWDTGHANISKEDQADSITLLGSRIKCTHIHNNWGVRDDHAPPIYGNIEWNRVMPALAAVGYRGPLTLETHCWYESDELLRSFAKHNYDSIAYLESLMKAQGR